MEAMLSYGKKKLWVSPQGGTPAIYGYLAPMGYRFGALGSALEFESASHMWCHLTATWCCEESDIAVAGLSSDITTPKQEEMFATLFLGETVYDAMTDRLWVVGLERNRNYSLYRDDDSLYSPTYRPHLEGFWWPADENFQQAIQLMNKNLVAEVTYHEFPTGLMARVQVRQAQRSYEYPVVRGTVRNGAYHATGWSQEQMVELPGIPSQWGPRLVATLWQAAQERGHDVFEVRGPRAELIPTLQNAPKYWGYTELPSEQGVLHALCACTAKGTLRCPASLASQLIGKGGERIRRFAFQHGLSYITVQSC